MLCARPAGRRRRQFKQEYDPQHGGFGGAPKFPRPSLPAFLLRHGVRAGDAEAVQMVLHTCDAMAAGGMHDQLGGGFARYSVDAQWLVPHFEKMLYDNAQLVNLYLDAWLVSGEARHADVARGILRLRPARHDPSRRRLLLRRRRRQRRQGGQVLLLDDGRTVPTADAGGVPGGRALFRPDRTGQFRGPQRSRSAAQPECFERGRPGPFPRRGEMRWNRPGKKCWTPAPAASARTWTTKSWPRGTA